MRQPAVVPGRPDQEPVLADAWTQPVAVTSPPIRVETVAVRRTGRWPAALVGLAVGLVALAIVKPWGSTDPSRSDVAPSPAAVAVVSVVASPSAVPSADSAPVAVDDVSAALSPGQVKCGSSDWGIVTLGTLLRWTVRSFTAITPVEARGAADPSIPVLSLGSSDIVGMGACAPSSGPGAQGRASRIIAAWLASPGVGAATPTYVRVSLADLDRLPPDGSPAASSTPGSVAELVRPFPATPRGRWPAGHYVLLLASPDGGPDRWIAVDVGSAGM